MALACSIVNNLAGLYSAADMERVLQKTLARLAALPFEHLLVYWPPRPPIFLGTAQATTDKDNPRRGFRQRNAACGVTRRKWLDQSRQAARCDFDGATCYPALLIRPAVHRLDDRFRL